jgi:sulfite reductase (NADPH) hemoprotein beta-component
MRRRGPTGPVPLHIKDRIRAAGPSVRPDLAIVPGRKAAELGDLMYRYDEYDQAIVDARVDEFRDQVQRRLSGELSEDQFKPLRLMNGLYLQLHAYMLRVAIPYGTLSGRQMRMLAHIARKYDRDYGHFTTRQNLQFNWIKLEETPDILAELATVEMHAIQTSGNCIRNISSDQFAGAAADEVADPRPYAELLRQWSTFHPEFTCCRASSSSR